VVVLLIQLAVGIGLIAWWLVPILTQSERSLNPFAILGSAVAGIALIFASFGWTQINAGEVGVVTSFGRVEQQELGPGLHWRIPFFTKVTPMDTRVQAYQFDGIEAFTKEQQPARLAGIVNYAIDPDEASTLFQTVGPDYVNRLIVSRADASLKENARKFATDLITAQRTELGELTAEELRSDLEPFNIQIVGVVVRDIGLSPEYLAAVERRQQAQIDQERANIDAETARRIAQGEADAQAIVADGQARSNQIITESLSPELIQWQAVQKLNPNVNVMLVPSDQGFLINMGIPEATPAP
jgi:prohibitin 1